MVMEGKQWKEILSVIDKEEGLSKDNVIERIKEKLKVKDEDEYQKWEKAGFSLNHLFQVTFYREAVELTLLYLAAQGHTEIVEVLLQAKGVDINAASKLGYTSLHIATLQNHTGIVKILIKNGADPLLENNNGQIPRDLAQGDVIKGLLEKAAKPQLGKRAFKKSVIYGGSTAVLGAAIAVALFATGTIAVELIPIVIAVATVAIATLAVGGITYMMSKPSTKVDEAEEKKTAGNGIIYYKSSTKY